MPVRRGRLMPVLASAALLVGAANLGAYAATGGPLLAGKSNSASKTTTLKTTGNGAALSLKSKKGKAPLKVSSATKVAKLNADSVDGLDSGALKTKTFVYTLTATAISENFAQFALPKLPPGRYVVDFSISAAVTGSVTFFGCFLVTGVFPSGGAPVAALGIESTDNWFVSGSGYVDTTSKTYRLSCQQSGGATMSIPALPGLPQTIAFTRVDDATVAGSTAAPATSGRSFEVPTR